MYCYINNESTEVQTLVAIRIQLYHQCFEQVWQHNFTSIIGLRGRHNAIDLRRSAHRSSIFEGRHIYHRSSKVDTSIVDLRKSTHRSSKVDTSIFEDRRRKHRTNIPTIRHRILSTTAIHSYTIDIIGYVFIVSTVIPRIPRGTHNIGRRYTRPYTYIRQQSHTCTSYVLYVYLYCVNALVGGAISIRDLYIHAVSRVCANGSHAVFHRPVVCAVKT